MTKGARRSDDDEPEDRRHNGSLPRYLWLAPRDEDLAVVRDAWVNGRDPREVWNDE